MSEKLSGEKLEVWHTAKGYQIDFKNVLREIDEYVKAGGKVFIGSDSQIKGDQVVFASVICLHGNVSEKMYSRYFFKKIISPRKKGRPMRQRIMKEVELSIDLAMKLIEKYPSANIEVHVDVGRTIRSKTSKYADMIDGWLKGVGIDCKMKPYSWASSAVADHHTK